MSSEMGSNFFPHVCTYQLCAMKNDSFSHVYFFIVCRFQICRLCGPQYGVKLLWRHLGNYIASVAAICVHA